MVVMGVVEVEFAGAFFPQVLQTLLRECLSW
jgi:hypothetical protein